MPVGRADPAARGLGTIRVGLGLMAPAARRRIAAVDDIAIGRVVARQMREAAEIDRVGELLPQVAKLLVAARRDR